MVRRDDGRIDDLQHQGTWRHITHRSIIKTTFLLYWAAGAATQQAWSKAGGMVGDAADATSRAGGFTDDGRSRRVVNDKADTKDTEERMDLILIVLILVLVFGGGLGYSRWGYGGGIGIGGILLIVLVVYLLLGRGRF
jgi:hypothetical protein